MEKLPIEKSLAEKSHFQLKYKDLDRDLVTYLAYFNRKLDDFRDKEILDIGSGSANFAKDAKVHGINVTSVDQVYMLREGRKKLHEDKFWRKIKRLVTLKGKIPPQAAAALGRDLPFREGQFDVITSVNAAFYYSENQKEVEENLKESLRVLKKGGKLLIHPILYPDSRKMMEFHENEKEDELRQAFNKLVHEMENRGEIEAEVKDSRNFIGHQLNPPGNLEHQGYLEITKL
jgi:ubiquinone/menaquinone biosynthesis C-methylase UbiE